MPGMNQMVNLIAQFTGKSSTKKTLKIRNKYVDQMASPTPICASLPACH